MSTNTNSQRKYAVGVLLPEIPRERRSSKHSVRTRLTMRYIRLGGQAARQPPVEINQDVRSIRGSDPIRIEYQGQEPSLTLRPQLHQAIHIKTFAAMRRYGGFPDVYAKSGWGHNQVENFVISGKHWTTEVMNLCREIRFSLRSNLDYDQGVPGQYNASHAEKQLVAYFIHKHLFPQHKVNLEGESESKSESEGDVARLLGNLTLAGENEQTAKDKLIELCKSRPQQPLNRAVILVSRPVCSDCERFARHVQIHLGLQIEIQSVQAVCSSTRLEDKV
ncbi:DYW family of nucleic acid deaminases domain-containing protein [Trichoderma barbatum]